MSTFTRRFFSLGLVTLLTACTTLPEVEPSIVKTLAPSGHSPMQNTPSLTITGISSMATRQPLAASANAISRPSRLAAPVTRTTGGGDAGFMW